MSSSLHCNSKNMQKTFGAQSVTDASTNLDRVFHQVETMAEW
jgi:hypothetical protein